MREAASLTWGDVRGPRGGSGQVRVRGPILTIDKTIFEMWLWGSVNLPRPLIQVLWRDWAGVKGGGKVDHVGGSTA